MESNIRMDSMLPRQV